MKLPVYEVLEFPTLTKLGSLPIAMINETKTRILSQQWNFDYVFYTEADNVSTYLVSVTTVLLNSFFFLFLFFFLIFWNGIIRSY